MGERTRKQMFLEQDDASDGRRKRVWTPEEDELLRQAVQRYGERAWAKIAEELPGRVGKQCRDRWCNHLSPDLEKKKWTEEEDKKLFDAVERMGNQWAEISRKILPGRSDLSIKNRYYSKLRRDHRRAENTALQMSKSSPVTSSPENVVSVPPSISEAPAKRVKASAEKGNASKARKANGGGKNSGKKSDSAGSKRSRAPNNLVPLNSGTMGALLSASTSTSPTNAMFGSMLPQLNALSAAAAASGEQQGESNGGTSHQMFFPYGGPAAGGWGSNTFYGHNPFLHPYSPLASLSNTPVPSPPRSPSAQPVPTMALTALSTLPSLGPSATSAQNLSAMNASLMSGPQQQPLYQQQQQQHQQQSQSHQTSGSTNAGSGESRPTSPSSFTIPLQNATGGTFFGSYWFPGVTNGGVEGGSGGVTPVSTLGVNTNAVLSQLQQHTHNIAAGKDGIGCDGTISPPTEFAAFAQAFNLPRVFGSTAGSSPSSSPGSGPISLGAQPGAKPNGTLPQPSDWFPAIGSHGLEYRQHPRPYGSADGMMGDLPPPALAAPQPMMTAASLLGVGGPFLGAAPGAGVGGMGAAPSLPNSTKKRQPTMKATKKNPVGANTGRWSPKEHHRFQEAIAKYGTQDWSLVANHVKTRTIVQVRSHAQKYFMRKDAAARLAEVAKGATDSSKADGSGVNGPGGNLDHPFDGQEVVEQALRSLEDGHANLDDDDDDDDDGLPAEHSHGYDPESDAIDDSSTGQKFADGGGDGMTTGLETTSEGDHLVSAPTSPSGDMAHEMPPQMHSLDDHNSEDSVPRATVVSQSEALPAM